MLDSQQMGGWWAFLPLSSYKGKPDFALEDDLKGS
jgi:hypothetical protein